METELNAGGRVTLDGEAEHYVRTVLRLKKHDGIVLFNGNGGEYRATLAECSRKNVSADILEWIDRSAESPLTVEFGLAVSRSDRMDFALQKSVELGVGRITPLLTERCVVQLSGERLSQKMQHWQKIARHAAEQCGRTLVPELAEALSLPDWL
ncbi:MAG: RsmE family RNA methyltransferase, partial [Gammaproteobacteria bacterium]